MATGLNVWIAKPGSACRVDDKAWRVTVYDAHLQIFEWAGVSYADLPAPKAHWAGPIPPGTYVVKAVSEATGESTDHAIAVVCCDDVACVRLFVAGPRKPEQPHPGRCEIKIQEVTGVGQGAPSSITVVGTAAKCKKIEVTVACNSGQVQTVVVPVSSSGSWTATVKAQGLECRCGRRVKIIARCTEDPECRDVFETDKLRCKPPSTEPDTPK